MELEIVNQVQEAQSPIQNKPKVKHPKTHINQINKDQTQGTNIKSSKGKKNKQIPALQVDSSPTELTGSPTE